MSLLLEAFAWFLVIVGVIYLAWRGMDAIEDRIDTRRARGYWADLTTNTAHKRNAS